MKRIAQSNCGLNLSYFKQGCLIAALTFSGSSLAELSCQAPAKPKAKVAPLSTLVDEILVVSDQTDWQQQQQAEFFGNVVIYQQQQTVSADQAVYDETNQIFQALGNVEVNSTSAIVSGDSIFIDDNNKNFELLSADYQFSFNSGRGAADKFAIENNNELLLTGATFTTCSAENPAWLFSSSQININQEHGWGEAWNTTFKIKDVPVVYIPYLTFPVSDKRKTGLLFPQLGNSSRYGAYYAQPVYFNLKPNMDFTLTPKYMSDRGLQLAGTLRHMSHNSDNLVQLEYLAEDKNSPQLGGRHLAYINHESNWADNWKVHLRWTDISDDNYISEFGSRYHHQADTYLTNQVAVNYYGEQNSFVIQTQDIKTLGQPATHYQLPLQLRYRWHPTDTTEQLQFDVDSLYSLFENQTNDINQVQRLHLEPKASLNWYSPGVELSASASYLSTFYQQQSISSETQNTDRHLAKFRLLGGLVLEKQSSYFGKKVRQTFEPKVQYLYVEEADQSQIGVYDSQLLKQDYYSLFRDNSYSGLDRIAHMNQATVGFSTSIFDNTNRELFRLGLGQIYKFANAKGTNDESVSSKPAIAVEWFGQLSKYWQIDGGLLYNQEQEQFDTAFISLDYWLSEDNNVQVNHRFVNDVAGQKINQSGVFSSYRLSDTWSIAASYHYDFEQEVSLDGLIGFEYRSCCWSVQFAAQRQVILDLNQTDFNNDKQLQYDNSIGFNFKINGLGGDISSSIANLFSDSIFAYRRPYLITN